MVCNLTDIKRERRHSTRREAIEKITAIQRNSLIKQKDLLNVNSWVSVNKDNELLYEDR